MTTLPKTYSNMKNYHVSAVEQGENIVFTHFLEEGAASRSYGLHVAELAGINNEILANAKEKLQELEKENNHISLLSSSLENELKKLDLSNTTPMQAMEWLHSKQKSLK